MPEVTFAVVGAGTVFNAHKRGLTQPNLRLLAIADVNAEAAHKAAADFDIPAFTDHKTMLRDVRADVCVIIAPHPFHAPIALDALAAGCHVLVEKPMAVHVGEADAMIAAAAKADKILAVNFQQRTRPEIVAAKQIIDSGALGKIQHVDIQMTWTRPAAYFAAAPWRGTWKGEGGAVLLNQGAHELDLFCYLAGTPKRIVAWARTIAHNIQAEDTVQAMVEWEDGALGSIHLSTAEAGRPQRIEILGTGGRLTIEQQGSQVSFGRFDAELLEFLRTNPDAFASPKQIEQEVTLPADTKGEHADIYRDLHRAITTNTAPIAPGTSGIAGLELANAIIYSSYNGAQTVDLPLDRAAYSALLDELRAGKR